MVIKMNRTTIRCWVLDLSIRGKKGIQDRRYICTNIKNLESHRAKLEDHIEKWRIWPSRIRKDSIERGKIKLTTQKIHPKDV